MNGLLVKQVDPKECEDLILNVHYAGRKPSISWAFGLFDKEEMIGCCTFGTPPSPPLRNGVAGKENAHLVKELNRLVLRYNRPNEASHLVASSLKLLPRPMIVVSFADTEQGHVGVVYQATNFIYTGLSAKRTDWKVRGQEHKHGVTIADESRGQPNRAEYMRNKYGDDFYLQPRPRKHRYIYVLGNKKEKRELVSAIRYKQLPYSSIK